MDADPGLSKLVHEAAHFAAREVISAIQAGGLPPPAEYLSARDAGAFLGLTEKAMEHLRQRGEGPRFLKWGKLVRYRVSDLREWAERGA